MLNQKNNNMKKVIFLVLSIIVLCGLNSWAGKTVGYIKTGDQIYFGQEVKIGISKTKIIAADGTIVKIPNSKVEAYMQDSHLFELMPLSNKSDGIAKMDLMEKITTRDGLVLYRYDSSKNEHPGIVYYVFREGKLYLICNETNTLTVLQFFGINVVS
jgi:hypothetical protein